MSGGGGDVAPRAGAWVETLLAADIMIIIGSRTPCGCVG